LDTIVAFVGSKLFGLPLYPATLVLVDILLLAYLYFCDAAEQLGEVMKLCLECAKDPLLDSVDILESNWRIVRDILQRSSHVLPHLFVGLFLRKKDELSVGNLRKLVKAFDTIEDPVLQMKHSLCGREDRSDPIAWRGGGLGEGWLLLCSTASGDEGVL
jgi:hypothetical protein